jgi:hypothetical protein
MNKTYKDIIQNGDVIKYDISQHDKHFNSLIDDKIRYIENDRSLPINRKESEMTGNTFLFVGSQPNTFREHRYVDMGLPSGLKWATCNVGASSPQERGTPYAWGEVFDKKIFTPETSVFYNFPPTGLTPSLKALGFSSRYLMDVATEKWQIEYYDKNSFDYNPNDPRQTYKVADGYDGRTFGVSIMNSPYSLYGGVNMTWRTPTLDEFMELLSNCSCSVSPEGYISLKSNVNGKILTFPPTTPIVRDGNGNITPHFGCYYTSNESDKRVSSSLGIVRFPDSSLPDGVTSTIEQCGIGVALYDPRISNYVVLDVPKYYGMYIRPVISII